MSERGNPEEESFWLEFTAEAETVLDVADMAMAAFSYRQANRLPVSRDGLLYGGHTTVSRQELAPFASRRRPFAARPEVALVSGPEVTAKGKREKGPMVPEPPLKLVANGDYDRPLAFMYPDPKEGLSIVQVDVDGLLVANNREQIAVIAKCLEGIGLHNKLEATHSTGKKLIRRLAAGVGAASLLTGGLLVAGDNETPAPAPPAAQAPPAAVPPPESKPPASVPEPSGPEIFLRTGPIHNGGMVVDAEEGRGVDCQKSYDPPAGFPVAFGELRAPLDLDVDSLLEKTGRIFTGKTKQMMFFGEESGDKVAGRPELSGGYAIEYDPGNDRYLVYRFTIKQRSPKPSDPPMPGEYGDMYGRPLQQFSRSDLQRGASFNDGEKTFTARIQSGGNATEGPLRLTIQCNQPPR